MAEAQFNLALCYANGCGVSVNKSEGVKFYHLAAHQNYSSALYYADGNGVAKDVNQATYFRQLAIDPEV